MINGGFEDEARESMTSYPDAGPPLLLVSKLGPLAWFLLIIGGGGRLPLIPGK